MSRQRNVATQNAETRDAIERTARGYLEAPHETAWLAPCLRHHALDPEAGLLVELAWVAEQDGNLMRTTWLADDGRFWRIDVTVSRDGSTWDIDAFDDVTAATETSARQRGPGKSFGCLALDVQAELRRTHRA